MSFIKYYFKASTSLLLIILLSKLLFIAFNYGYLSKLSSSQIVYAIWFGLKFDFAIIGLITLMPSLYYLVCFRAKSKILNFKFYYLFVLLICLTQTADIIYFAYASKHIGYEVKYALTDASGLLGTAFNHHLDVIISTTILAILSLLFIGRLKPIKLELKCYYSNLFAILVFLVSIILIRGGLHPIPISPMSAYNIGNPNQANIALNGVYNAIYWLTKGREITKAVLPQVDPNEVTSSLNNIKSNVKQLSHQLTEANIVLIFLEGWAAKRIKSYGYLRDTAPFFDKLRRQSITSSLLLAGGHRTTEGMFTTFCSLQNPLGNTIANSSLQDFEYICLPHLLKQHNFSSHFFQGTLKESSFTGSFAKKLGFDKTYGKMDINNFTYEKNSWGAHDHDLYSFVLGEIPTIKEPFLVGINTNSTHDLHLPTNVKPKFGMSNDQNTRDSVLNFADEALETFFNKYQTLTLKKPTIWVLVADHTSGTHGDPLQSTSVPFAIYAKHLEPQNLNIIASQRDIAPTILQILGIKIPKHFSGMKLLTKTKIHYADYFQSGILGWAENNKLVEIPINSSHKPKCFNYQNKTRQEISCLGLESAINNAISFTKKSQDLLFFGETTKFSWQKQ